VEDEDSDGGRVGHDLILISATELFILVEARVRTLLARPHSLVLCHIVRLATLRQSPEVGHAISHARISSDFQGTSRLLSPSLPTHTLTRVTQATYSGIPVYEL
jgi:hypothetical protein